MSKRQDQIHLLGIIKTRIIEENLGFAFPQTAISMLNDIIEQLNKTETVRFRKEISPFYAPTDERIRREFAHEIANFIMENGYAEPKPVDINEKTKGERWELEIQFIKR